MTDAELRDAFSVPPPGSEMGSADWRSYRARMASALLELDAKLASQDKAELETLLSRASEIQARLGVPSTPAERTRKLVDRVICSECGGPGRNHDNSCSQFQPSSETDAGMGAGADRMPDMSAAEFQEMLRDTRQTNIAKRRQRLSERGS